MIEETVSSYEQICWMYSIRGNISTYVFLPMLKIYVGRFSDDLHDVYVGENYEVYMHLKKEFTEDFIFKSPYYQSDYTTDNGHLIIFIIPDEFRKDYDHFKNGRYSKFSRTLLKQIQTYSSLQSDNRLILAIEKDPMFKEVIEKVLDCTLSSRAEFMDKPLPRNFAKFEDFFKEELEEQ